MIHTCYFTDFDLYCVQRNGKPSRKSGNMEKKSMSNNLWREGTIGIPKKQGGYTVVHYWAKFH